MVKTEVSSLTKKYFVKSTLKKFTYLVKPLLSRNFCQKSVRENFCNFNTVGNLLLRIFGKNFVKVTVLLKKLLKSWFDEIFCDECDEHVITNDLKILLFNFRFSENWDCDPLIPVSVWTGIFLTLILVSFLYYAIDMVTSLQTPTKFDDAKSKPISVPTGE